MNNRLNYFLEEDNVNMKHLVPIEELSGTVQLYDKSIKQILNNNNSEEQTDNSKYSLSMILDEFNSNLDEMNMKTSDTELRMKIKDTKQKNDKVKSIIKNKRVFKSEIRSNLKYLSELLNTKLSKGLFKSLALSNPLTSIIYQNWDLVKGVYNAARANITNN